MGGEENAGGGGARKTYWRSASWSASRTSIPDCPGDATEKNQGNGQPRRCPAPPLTPRSQNNKARSCLPPLQPLSITRRSLDEWPRAGSDDVGEWPHPPTPGGGGGGAGLKLDLSTIRGHGRRDQLASFDKECSKVADHIYLGGDSVARNREILRQNGITHVLNCVGFVCSEYFKSDFVYRTLWLQDSPSEDITSILYDVFDYFEDVREQGGRVFVHCCQGVSRSTSLVIAYLMWREGQSFDDAFQFVKAARGIANPNMGFACQLLQCQKRVHAIPLSPNSVLRMYRMAPHSPYDALHLVPKMLSDPSPSALDSRGAFIVHIFSSIYVWVGKSCDPMMEKDAKAAAFQVVRYERVQGPIVVMEEGEELPEFWEEFSNAPLSSDSVRKVSKEEIESMIKIVGVGKRRVDSYDGDFELFYKAITGGVVPPFSSSGPGQETHIPARESNWSVLRRKFISGAISRVYSDSVLVRDGDARMSRVQLLSSETSISPPYLSPSSLSSDSSGSSKSSSESPSLSPSTSSSPSLTRSPPPSNLSDPLLTSYRPSFRFSSSLQPLKTCHEEVNLPFKGLAPSLAERRGSFSPLKLPALAKDMSLTDGKRIIESSACIESPQEILDKNNCVQTLDKDTLDCQNCDRQALELKDLSDAIVDKSQICFELQRSPRSQHCQLSFSSAESVDISLESPDLTQTLVFRWPSMEKMRTFGREDLDPEKVLLFITRDRSNGGEVGRMLYIWIGSCFEQASREAQLKSGRDVYKVNETDWTQVGSDFLTSVGLPSNVRIKVVKDQEPEEFLELLNSV